MELQLSYNKPEIINVPFSTTSEDVSLSPNFLLKEINLAVPEFPSFKKITLSTIYEFVYISLSLNMAVESLISHVDSTTVSNIDEQSLGNLDIYQNTTHNSK